MKKKIGEIYNKPIVTGDKNLVTRNEIHESNLMGGNGEGGTSVNDEALDEPLYYKLEWSEDITNGDAQNVLTYLNILPPNSYVVMKGGYKDMPQIEIPFKAAFGWEPTLHIKIKITNKYCTGKTEDDYGVYWSKMNVFDFMPALSEIFSNVGLNMIEISKEEYYSDIEVKYEDIPIQQMQ